MRESLVGLDARIMYGRAEREFNNKDYFLVLVLPYAWSRCYSVSLP